MLHELYKAAERALLTSFGAFFPEGSPFLVPEVVRSTQEAFGHYQCNNALKLAKELKKPPREVAQQLMDAFPKHLEGGREFIHHMEVAGAGFINITLAAAYLNGALQKMLHSPRLGVPFPEHPERVIVEFSSPNVAKELHVGHLRSTIIGDAIARLLEFLGHDVLRLNHIGDWGTQFGMLIAYMEEEVPGVLLSAELPSLEQLMQWYRASKKRFDEDPEFKKRAQKQVVRLQGGDSASLEAWEKICAISRKAFQEIYRLLDVKIVERGESFYNPYLKEVVEDLEKKGLVTISEGARCIFIEGFQTREGTLLPMIIQKSDGGYNYDTTDVAAMRHRVGVEKADRIIIVTDAGQSLHFQMVAKVAQQAGYLGKASFDHVTFGVVLGPDGKKFKTRSGETEKLIDLILEAVDKAKAIMKQRLPDASEEEIGRLATILGVDAIKYADLSCHRTKDYVFSYDKMLKFEGNTAAFLLYAYVRIQGIKRKVGKDLNSLLEKGRVALEHPSEIALGLHLCQFFETLEAFSKELLPNRLCEYLYILAEKFNHFFRDCRVEGSAEQESRLLLCAAAERVLAQGLHILGLETMTKM